ncbi:hypothetical protein CASFOL_026538 [Castilleja foliolosa]|uniref:Uncharacterized protein n=1 Tax=Castilleja foliolosa TaxID=1961234 RepID=A0ABD3CHG0_9LAMI
MTVMWSLFRDLHSEKNTCDVKAREIRNYLQPKFEYPKEIEKFKMVLHDQTVNVIGVVTSYQEPSYVDSVSKRLDFKLADTEGKQIICSLWGEYIDCLFPILAKEEKQWLLFVFNSGR